MQASCSLQSELRTGFGVSSLAGSRPFVPAIVALCSGFQTQRWQLNTRVAPLWDLTQHLTARADDSHAPPVSAFPKAPLSFKRIRGMSSPGGILNALATALHGSIRTAPSIHRLRLGLLGYLIPFAPSFRLSVSVSAQQSAFAVGVLSDLYAFHRSTGNSLCPYRTPA
ncbi:hypothetical protein H5410_063982 [Solanum commersonii]|uniref:Uncharacterized protein n=1 Tax=Solanum commersonii TaxID=4109 RepID=A0A9J5W1J4_SOLCO|nr:hypothetical protein H5410_063982 [Solanum commersonii]